MGVASGFLVNTPRKQPLAIESYPPPKSSDLPLFVISIKAPIQGTQISTSELPQMKLRLHLPPLPSPPSSPLSPSPQIPHEQLQRESKLTANSCSAAANSITWPHHFQRAR